MLKIGGYDGIGEVVRTDKHLTLKPHIEREIS